MKKVFLFLVTFAVSFNFVFAQTAEDDTNHYINYFRDIAISEMHRTGIPASITLAQGIHESNSGKSRLATQGNNHFGIKCHKGWTGSSMKHTDDAPDECFRTYASPQESYKDHSEFLVHRDRYNNCFNFPSTDYVNWAKELKKAGYATNPVYAEKLIEKIEKHYLYIYDQPDWENVLAIIEMNKKLSRGEDVLAAAPQTTTSYINEITETYTPTPITNQQTEVVSYTTNSNVETTTNNGLAPGEYVIREYSPFENTKAETSQPIETKQNNSHQQDYTTTSILKSPEQILQAHQTIAKTEPAPQPIIETTKIIDAAPTNEIVMTNHSVEVPSSKIEQPTIIQPSKKNKIEVATQPIANSNKVEAVVVKRKVESISANNLKPTSHITYFNRRKVVMYNYGVTALDVANDYDVRVQQLAKYNEVEGEDYIEANTKIYLQPKRKKGPWGKPYHKVESGETIYDIAQLYGVKSKKLRKMNLMANHQEPIIGEVVYLRKKRDYPPKTNQNSSNYNESITYNKGGDWLSGIKKLFNE